MTIEEAKKIRLEINKINNIFNMKKALISLSDDSKSFVPIIKNSDNFFNRLDLIDIKPGMKIEDIVIKLKETKIKLKDPRDPKYKNYIKEERDPLIEIVESLEKHFSKIGIELNSCIKNIKDIKNNEFGVEKKNKNWEKRINKIIPEDLNINNFEMSDLEDLTIELNEKINKLIDNELGNLKLEIEVKELETDVDFTVDDETIYTDGKHVIKIENLTIDKYLVYEEAIEELNKDGWEEEKYKSNLGKIVNFLENDASLYLEVDSIKQQENDLNFDLT